MRTFYRPVVPVPGPKPVASLKSNMPALAPIIAPRPTHHSNGNANNQGGSHQLSNGRQYPPAGSGSGNTSTVHNLSSTNKGFYNGNVQQYQHQENRRLMNLPPPSQQSNGNISSGFNGFHYPYQDTQQQFLQNPVLAPNPHHVGLPLGGFIPNHSTPS